MDFLFQATLVHRTLVVQPFYSLQKYKKKTFPQRRWSLCGRYVPQRNITCCNIAAHCRFNDNSKIIPFSVAARCFFVRVIAVIDIIIAVARIHFFRFNNPAETVLQLLIMVSWHYFQLKCLKLFPYLRQRKYFVHDKWNECCINNSVFFGRQTMTVRRFLSSSS